MDIYVNNFLPSLDLKIYNKNNRTESGIFRKVGQNSFKSIPHKYAILISPTYRL